MLTFFLIDKTLEARDLLLATKKQKVIEKRKERLPFGTNGKFRFDPESEKRWLDLTVVGK